MITPSLLPTHGNLAQAATELARAGVRLVPLYGIRTDGACQCSRGPTCSAPGKHPRIDAWQKNASSDPETVSRWVRQSGGNLGWAMGGPDRLVALDVDGETGRNSIAKLEGKHGPLPATLTSRSGRVDGGEHRIFHVPAHLDIDAIPNRASHMEPGLDVRSEGGQIVIPPSVHASGQLYAWKHIAPIAELPLWLYELMAKPQSDDDPINLALAAQLGHRQDDNDLRRRQRAYCLRWLEAQAEELAHAGNGNRNDALNQLVHQAAGFSAAGHLSQAEVWTHVAAAMRTNGYEKTDGARAIKATFLSAWNAGSRKPIDPRNVQPKIELPEVDLSSFSTAKPNAQSGFPSHLYDVPGLVGELHKYIVDSAPAQQPILALGAAIATVGTLAGRRIQSDSGLLTNVYVVALGESGSGKEWPRTAIRWALAAANLDAIASVDDVTSGAAINGALAAHPSCLMMLDELGHFIKESREKQSGIIKVLLRIYGTGVAPYRGTTYAVDRRTGRSGDDYCVYAPCASVYGTTVPARFWETLTSADVADGFLSRFLVFESEDPDPPDRVVHVDQQTPPPSLVDAIHRWHPIHDLAYQSSLAAGTKPDVRVIRTTPAAQRLLARFSDEMRTRRDNMRTSDDDTFVPLFKRARAFAAKLALIRAAGVWGPDLVEVDAADMTWGIELSTWCADTVLRRASAEIGDSEHDKCCKQAIAWLAERGGVARKNDLTRRFQHWGPRGREDVMATLVESGQVREMKERAQGRGRPAVVYALAGISSIDENTIASAPEMAANLS